MSDAFTMMMFIRNLAYYLFITTDTICIFLSKWHFADILVHNFLPGKAMSHQFLNQTLEKTLICSQPFEINPISRTHNQDSK